MIPQQLHLFVVVFFFFLASCAAIFSIKGAIHNADIAVLLKNESLDNAILELWLA